MEPNDHDKSSLSEPHIYVRDSATPSFHAYVFREVLTCASTSQDSPECIHLPFQFLFDPYLPVGSQDVIVHWILLVHVTLVVRQDITFRYVRRNKLQYLVHF